MNLTSFITAAALVLNGVAAAVQSSAMAKLSIMTLSDEIALKCMGDGLFSHLAFVTKYKKSVPVIEEQKMRQLIKFLNNEKSNLVEKQERLHSNQMRLIKELNDLIANERDYGRFNFLHSREFAENKMNKDKVNNEKRIIEQELAKVSWKLETIEQFLDYCPGGICGIVVPRETKVSLDDDDLHIAPLHGPND